MPRIRIPKLCRYKATGQAYVQLPGSKKQIYLGAFGSPAADAEYRRIVAELVADSASNVCDAATGRAFADVTVSELALKYLDHCETYYSGPDGKPSREVVNIELALRTFRSLYGHTPAREMGPRWLKTLQHTLVEQGLTRREINKRVGKVKRMIKWATAEEMIPSSIFHALQAVEGLRRGRSGAKEHEPVRPVPDAQVNAVEPFVSRQVWAMIELQRHTGMRPGEVALMRTGDIDRSGTVWTYQPSHHKTSFHGHERKVFLGPKAQAVLQHWLRADPEAFLFQPVEAEEERNAARRANRKSPMTPSQRKRKSKAAPKRAKRECYDVASYRRAIKYGCKRAEVPNWHPHQLRHNAATALRKEFGVDVAEVILGLRDTPRREEFYLSTFWSIDAPVPGSNAAGTQFFGMRLQMAETGELTGGASGYSVSDLDDVPHLTEAIPFDVLTAAPASFERLPIDDPANRGRRIYRIIPDERFSDPPSIAATYELVLAPTVAGPHRLLVRQGGALRGVAPLRDAEFDERLRRGGELETLPEAERLAVRSLKSGVDAGSVRYRIERGSVVEMDVSGAYVAKADVVLPSLKRLRSIRLKGRRGARSNEKPLTNLASLQSLESLDLVSLPHTDAILEQVGKLPRLTRLDIHACANLSDEGLSRLRGLTNLMELRITGDSAKDQRSVVSEAGWSAIGALTTLKVLDLTGLPATDASLARLKNLERLRDLSLSGPALTDLSVMNLRGFYVLQTLELRDTGLTDEGLMQLGRGLFVLNSLDVRGMKLTQEGKRRLKERRPLLLIH